MIELCQMSLCTGCGACYNACPHNSIEMVPSIGEGFLYPRINQASCISCGVCVKSCPILTPPSKSDVPEVCAA